MPLGAGASAEVALERLEARPRLVPPGPVHLPPHPSAPASFPTSPPSEPPGQKRVSQEGLLQMAGVSS